MAEEEIRKHAKAAYQAVQGSGKGWKHKIGEIFTEILIIVFAVSVSIWLHNWAEDRKDRQEEKEFLDGLITDLKADKAEMEDDRKVLIKYAHGVAYFKAVGDGNAIYSRDSLLTYVALFFTQVQVSPRISRFEALKGSGKLFIIRNKELLLAITDLYAKDFPRINTMNISYTNIVNNKLTPYLETHLELGPDRVGTNWETLLKSSQLRLLVGQSVAVANCVTAYTAAIDRCNLIIGMIGKGE